MNLGGFSWRRAIGLSTAKARLSASTRHPSRARCRRRGYRPRALRLLPWCPIVGLLVAPAAARIRAIAALSLVSLTALGAFGGHLGGAPLGRAALRVTIGGALAMAVTAAIGRIVGVAVG